MKKIEIIPAINAKNFSEVKEKLNFIEPFSNWAHIDVSDGVFTETLLWNKSAELKNLETRVKIEIHLMVSCPEKIIDDWMIKNVKRIIFNIESSENPEYIIKKCGERGIEAGISLGPGEPLSRLKPFFLSVNFFQILAVLPGRAGQEFLPQSLEKIKELRQEREMCDIEVDGGINLETGRESINAGANILVSASYIFQGDINNRIKLLKELAV